MQAQDIGCILDMEVAQGRIADRSAHTARKAYEAPSLMNYGAVRDLTTGGSRNQVSEFVRCDNQQFIFRC